MSSSSSPSTKNLESFNSQSHQNGENLSLNGEIKIVMENAEEEPLSILQAAELPTKLAPKDVECKKLRFKNKEYKIRPSLLT